MNSSSSRWRYLVLTELFLPTKGGTAVWFDEVYRRIGNRSTHILTAKVPDAQLHDATHPNTVHRLRLTSSRWMRPASLPRYIKLLLSALWLVASRRFDAVHAGRVLPEGYVALIVARLARLPCVIYAHGEEITTWRRSPRRLRAMRRVYTRANIVIANSEFTRSQLVELGVRADRVRVVAPGVDVDRFRPGLDSQELRDSIGISNEQRLVLSVGRLTRRKGFDQIIKALPRLHADGIPVHYALVGIGEDQCYLEALARKHQVAGNVHFLGHVAPDDLPRWYNAADVFAMPNREIDGDTEGFGMVFLEAAACARPAVAGKAGGTGDAVIDGDTGRRVDGGSVEAVTGALSELLRDPALAQRMGRAGHDRASSEFSWEQVAKKIERTR